MPKKKINHNTIEQKEFRVFNPEDVKQVVEISVKPKPKLEELETIEKIKDLEKKIMVSHMHAAGTKSEFSGFKGSEALRHAIKEFKPDLFISGHIHEAEGIEEKIGKTKVISVGRRGRIIEI